MPSGGDGYYYFSVYLVGSHSEDVHFDMELNDDVICTSFLDQGNSGDLDYPSASCSAIVNIVDGNAI